MTDLPSCGFCGSTHLSMQAAMECCSEEFDDDPGAPEVAA